MGFCGLDRTRSPLRGDEIRGCWEAAAARVGLGSRQPATGNGGDALNVVASDSPEFSLFADAD
jgi:hypothetical protein